MLPSGFQIHLVLASSCLQQSSYLSVAQKPMGVGNKWAGVGRSRYLGQEDRFCALDVLIRQVLRAEVASGVTSAGCLFTKHSGVGADGRKWHKGPMGQGRAVHALHGYH